MHNLVKTWGLIERHGKRGDVRYTLSAEGIRYITHRDRAELPTTRDIWSTALTIDRQGRRRHMGHRIETWARQTKHADGITWFLSKLEAEARTDPDSELLWSVPTARSDRAYNWGQSAIAPDAVGKMVAQGLEIPFYFEYELRARHPRGVIARLEPYTSYYWSPEHKDDQPPFPVTLFVVDTEEVEDTYVRTAPRMSRMSLPIFVSCIPVLSNTGVLGRSWRPLWEPESPSWPAGAGAPTHWTRRGHPSGATSPAPGAASCSGTSSTPKRCIASLQRWLIRHTLWAGSCCRSTRPAGPPGIFATESGSTRSTPTLTAQSAGPMRRGPSSWSGSAGRYAP